MKVAEYLGAQVSTLLTSRPFAAWRVTRSVEEDLPQKEIWYEFKGHGVEVICDETERIRTIFLRSGDGEALAEIPFSLSRREALDRFGRASKSGDRVRIPGLGDKGAWDRFTCTWGSIHIQYRLDGDEIDMVTLMARGTEP